MPPNFLTFWGHKFVLPDLMHRWLTDRPEQTQLLHGRVC